MGLKLNSKVPLSPTKVTRVASKVDRLRAERQARSAAQDLVELNPSGESGRGPNVRDEAQRHLHLSELGRPAPPACDPAVRDVVGNSKMPQRNRCS